MESAETQDTQDYISRQQRLEEIDTEEMEELRCISNAVSEPRCALHMCDNKCSKESYKFYQLAAMVTEGGGKARTNQLVQAM